MTTFYFVIAVVPDSPTEFIIQSKRKIPVMQSVDIVVVGGSTSAVSAAVSSSEQGARVFLVAPKTYLGAVFLAIISSTYKEENSTPNFIVFSLTIRSSLTWVAMGVLCMEPLQLTGWLKLASGSPMPVLPVLFVLLQE